MESQYFLALKPLSLTPFFCLMFATTNMKKSLGLGAKRHTDACGHSGAGKAAGRGWAEGPVHQEEMAPALTGSAGSRREGGLFVSLDYSCTRELNK